MPIGTSKIGALGGQVPGGSQTFNTSGTFIVPVGVTKLNVTGKGAQETLGTLEILETLGALVTAPVAEGVAAVQKLLFLFHPLQADLVVVLLLTLVRLQQPNS